MDTMFIRRKDAFAFVIHAVMLRRDRIQKSKANKCCTRYDNVIKNFSFFVFLFCKSDTWTEYRILFSILLSKTFSFQFCIRLFIAHERNKY